MSCTAGSNCIRKLTGASCSSCCGCLKPTCRFCRPALARLAAQAEAQRALQRMLMQRTGGLLSK